MKFYIDLDYTMMDTTRFHEARYKLLEEYGITHEQQEEMIKYIMKEEKKLLNLDYLCIKLCEKYNLPKEEILTKINEIIDNSYIYLYEDTIDFLEFLKNEGHNLYILTWGDKELQFQKIKGAKIQKYFDDIILTEELKFNIDIDYQDGIFIDDNPRDLEGLYNRNPIDVIRIKRENGKYSEKPSSINFKEYKSLKEFIDNYYRSSVSEDKEGM